MTPPARLANVSSPLVTCQYKRRLVGLFVAPDSRQHTPALHIWHFVDPDKAELFALDRRVWNAMGCELFAADFTCHSGSVQASLPTCASSRLHARDPTVSFTRA